MQTKQKNIAHSHTIDPSLKESQDTLALLADASKVLISSLDYQEILKNIAKLAVPRFADFCVFDILTDENSIKRITWEHADISLKEYIQIVDTFTPSIDYTSNPVAYSLRYGKSTLIASVDDLWLQKAATTPEHLEFQRTLGYRSIISVPLQVRDKVNGVLTFIFTKFSNRQYSESDVHVAEEIATRAALAIENARLYENSHASAERLRLALEAGRIGVWDWDIQKNTIEWSDRVYAFYGATRDTFDVTYENFSKHIHPDDKVMTDEAILKAVEGSQEYNIVYRIITLDGQTRWISSRAVVTRDVSGKPLRMLGATSDVTEQKKIEQDKNDFVSIATHELKTPVTSIKAYAQVLEKKFHRIGDASSAIQLAKMNAQLDKLTSLIADLLDATKIESGQLQMHEERFDFDVLVSEIVEELQRTTEKHTIIVEGKTDKKIVADKERIGQVLTNLISNAIKYSPHSEKILVQPSVINKNIQLCIQDFGVGIPKEKQTQVFERFYRVSGPKEITFPGLGLGLYISSEILKRMGGKIWVESEVGKGSTFCFTLPLSAR
jgi:PAS domain S-box-containing protein